MNVTANYLFRKVSAEEGAPTILYDEVDTIFGPRAKENEELRGMLNAGHRKGAIAGRAVVMGKKVVTEDLPAYCAVALAGLDDLPDTIMTRSVVVRMRRRAPGEKVEPWRLRAERATAEALSDRIIEWSTNSRHALDDWPQMPKGVEDRNADVWEALLAVADLAGSAWPERARVAAVTLVTDSRAAQTSMGVTLLRDLRDIFTRHGADRISTADLLDELISLDESPWGDIRGKQLDARGLSNRLRRYDVKPTTIRFGTDVVKGYRSEDLSDPWNRYLQGETVEPISSTPPQAPESVTSVTAEPVEPAVTAPPEISVTAVTPEQVEPAPDPAWDWNRRNDPHPGESATEPAQPERLDFYAAFAAFDEIASLPGRCRECAMHIEMQGHRDSCSQAVT